MFLSIVKGLVCMLFVATIVVHSLAGCHNLFLLKTIITYLIVVVVVVHVDHFREHGDTNSVRNFFLPRVKHTK